MTETILIVEDDPNVSEGLRDILTGYGYEACAASTLREAMEAFHRLPVDLVVLDVSLRQDSGYDVCRQIRKESDVPVLFLTACSSEMEVVRGFQTGGDDYVVKPFRVQELLLRIQALLRRSHRPEEAVVKSGSLFLRPDRHEARKNGEALELTSTEWKLLSLLIHQYPRVLSREELLYQVWDRDSAFVEANTLNVNISRLREKLSDFEGAPYIETVRGVGYRWAVPVSG